ncbi:MAG TPA: hypothetical protein VJ111_13270 [Chitinophagaceae bacterium]|nr:hypothetical protein [Chitinophagaceae bacterium]
MTQIVANLKQQSQTIGSNSQKIQQVATISANNDENIGKLITQAFDKVGKEGVITVGEWIIKGDSVKKNKNKKHVYQTTGSIHFIY